MALEVYSTGTEYLANQITLTRGTVGDIARVGVYHNTDPNVKPTPEQFTTVDLVNGTTTPPDPLAETGKIDLLSLIGARSSEPSLALAPGDYQRWGLVSTATEDIIRKIDTITVL